MALTLQTAFAGSPATSVNVAVIPSYSGSGGAGVLNPANFPSVTMPPVAYAAITTASQLAAYDTVILYQACNVQSYPNLCSALTDWMKNYSGKLIIWDADSCYPGNYAYTFLNPVGAFFERFSPGQTGNFGGSVTILEDNQFNSPNSASAYYINTTAMTSQTDAVGDLNVVNENTVSGVWCALMRGVNTANRSGYGHMYTKPGGLTDAPDAMIIYCGFDTDYWGYGYNGSLAMLKLLRQELQHGWGPPGSPEVADLSCQAPVGNLVLTPATAVNPVGDQHTVTATVTVYNFSTGQTVPQAGVTVNFLITSGPNAGASGSGVSDSQGHVMWTYSTSGQGVDTIQATATVNGVVKTAMAQKTWCNPPTIAAALAGNRGYYRLIAASDCYAAANLQVFIADTGSGQIAGPYASGLVFRIVKKAAFSIGPGTATAAATINVVGNAVAYAVDPLGSSSAGVVLKPAM